MIISVHFEGEIEVEVEDTIVSDRISDSDRARVIGQYVQNAIGYTGVQVESVTEYNMKD